MLYFVYGPDGYRVKQAILSIIRNIQESTKLPVASAWIALDEPEALATLDGILKNTGLFPEHRCAVISGAFSHKKYAQELLERLDRTGVHAWKEMTLIITETAEEPSLTRKHKELLVALTSGAKTVPVPFLTPVRLSEWVSDEFTKRNTTADPAAVRELLGRIGQESWALIQEIEKISNYSAPGPVTVQTVLTLVPERGESNIFRFTDALVAKDKGQALSLLHRELNSGQEPYSVLAAVIYQFRNLLMAKDLSLRSPWSAGLAQKLGVPPFVAQKLASAARKFELAELTAHYERLSNLDTRAKQGRIDLKDALYLFVLGTF